jgi:hypothetical protein
MEPSRTGNQQEINSRIINLMKIRGPILPIHAARETNLSLLLTGAFLSSLVSEKAIKISNLKVGGSPVYFLQGQEPMLENFIKFLPQKEREAFTMLKDRKFLKDSELDPVIRVALRNIKDFAIPFKLESIPDTLFWRFFLVNDVELEKEIEKFRPKPEIKSEEKKIEIKEELKPKPEIKTGLELKRAEKPKVEEIKKEIKPVIERKEIQKPLGIEKHEKKPRKAREKVKDTRFREEVNAFLLKKDIELVQEMSYDKAEVLGKVRINSDLGKISFLLIAKDKKKLSEADLILAYQKAQNEKMPCLFLSKAEISKKTQESMEQYKNLIKLEKIG